MAGLVRRMCILKGVKSGFSQNGGALSGVARVETYAGKCTVSVSLINFAPLSQGRYYCILCDKEGEKILFPVSAQGGTFCKEGAFSPEKGFLCLVAFYRTECDLLATGQYGAGTYNIKLLLESVAAPPEKKEKKDLPAPPAQPILEKEIVLVKGSDYPERENTDGLYDDDGEEGGICHKSDGDGYDDEAISDGNYYGDGGVERAGAAAEDATSAAKNPNEKDGSASSENETIEDPFHPFAFPEGETYYLTIKDELERLFASSEETHALDFAFENGEWVKMKDADVYVGVLRENGLVRYIAYALPTDRKTPPEELKNACFLPDFSAFSDGSDRGEKGYFVLFQDAETGETATVVPS